MDKIDTSKMVTGQLFFRGTRRECLNKDGRKLMMVVGVIAVPDNFAMKEEHQYVVSGLGPGTILIVDPETGIDYTDLARGLALGQLVTEPIWRT
jgi:hypothetical protein